MVLPNISSLLFAPTVTLLLAAGVFLSVELLRLHFRLKRLETRAAALEAIPKIEWPKKPSEEANQTT
jgi:hypothetical protein